MTQNVPSDRSSFDLARLFVIGGVNYTVLGLGSIGLIVSILVYQIFGFRFGFPDAIAERIDFIAAINVGEDWLKANVRSTTRAIAKVITSFIDEVEYFLQLFLNWVRGRSSTMLSRSGGTL